MCMKKMNEKLGAFALSAILLMATGTTAFATAAWDSFTATLPAKQGDTEVSTVARDVSDTDYFTIKISSIGGGYTAVRAWCETGLGTNVSSPDYEIGVNTSGYHWDIPYYSNSVPSHGTNVTLNLDNPVNTTNTPTVKGSWTPN